MVEKQELYCHACQNYVQFDLDLSVDGNYRLDCPNCGHDHYRVVKKGKITDVRYARFKSQQDQQWISVSAATYSAAGTFTTSTASSFYLYSSWMNSTATS